MSRVTSFLRAVGVEGAFLTIGTVLIAVGSSYFSAAGPWFVVGAVCVLIAVYAIHEQRRPRSN